MGLLGGLANRITAITGRTNWRADPAATLADAKAHHDRTDNPHSVTSVQVGAASDTDLSSHTADQSNPHGVTASQAGAKPSSYVPAWTEVSGKPTAFTPTAHKATHTTGGSDALAPADIGASPTHNHPYAPSSHVGSGGSAHAGAVPNGAAGFISGSNQAKVDAVRPNDAYCDLSLSAHQTGIQNATWTPVYWNSEAADPRNWHSNTTNPERITFDVAGFYAVTFYQRWASANASGVRYLRGQMNGGTNLFEDSVSAAVDSIGRVTAARMFAVSAGDYFVLEVNQTSGSALDLHSVSGVAIARIM